jgi:hypothetical protein
MAKTPTAYLALMLPVPGSKEPFRVSDVNGWFTTLDTKIQSMDGVSTGLDTRLDTIEPYLLPGFTAANARYGLTPAGTTAQRNAYWGSPAAGQARIDLANRFARWFNTDKGYVEQYFCAFDETGTGKVAGTPQKKTARWAPDMTAGRVPISTFTVSGGTAANIKKYGSSVEVVTPGSTGINIDGCFTADFDAYEIDIELLNVASASDLTFQFRAGGTTNVGTVYQTERGGASGASVTSIGVGGQTLIGIASLSTTEGGFCRLSLTSPAQTEWKRIQFMGGNTLNAVLWGTAMAKIATAVDGFRIDNGGAITRATIRVYGISNGL